MHFNDIEIQFNREERNNDIVKDGGLLVFLHKLRLIGARKYVDMEKEIDMCYWYILNNCEDVLVYIKLLLVSSNLNN